LLDEVFGSDNFIRQITFKKTTGGTADFIPGTCDFLMWYGKNVAVAKYRPIYNLKELGGEGTTGYTRVELPDGTRRPLNQTEFADPSCLPKGARIYAAANITSQSMGREKGEGAASWFPVKIGGQEYRPSMKARWKTNEQGMSHLLAASRVLVGRKSTRILPIL
jgi:adenine-specific DNA-methyltransferase